MIKIPVTSTVPVTAVPTTTHKVTIPMTVPMPIPLSEESAKKIIKARRIMQPDEPTHLKNRKLLNISCNPPAAAPVLSPYQNQPPPAAAAPPITTKMAPNFPIAQQPFFIRCGRKIQRPATKGHVNVSNVEGVGSGPVVLMGKGKANNRVAPSAAAENSIIRPPSHSLEQTRASRKKITSPKENPPVITLPNIGLDEGDSLAFNKMFKII